MNRERFQRILGIAKVDDGHWLMDLGGGRPQHSLDPNDLDAAFSHMVVLVDAKRFITDHGISLNTNSEVICLNTLQKLLSCSLMEIEPPTFHSIDIAESWIKGCLMDCFQQIEKRGIELLAKLECQLIPAVVSMERRGIPFLSAKWQEKLEGIKREEGSIRAKLNRLLKNNDGFLLFQPEAVDLNNSALVKSSLERLIDKKLKNTSRSSLEDIDHEGARLVLRYREFARILANYGEGFLQGITNNRIRGIFNPIGSLSGRMSCHHLNLLALPNLGSFQECIKPEPHHRMVHFDFSAFELRILASLSDDHNLIDIFRHERDIHSMVAEAIFKKPVSKDNNAHLRDQAKVLSFGLIYGMGEQALAQRLKISLSQARTLMHNYFARFPRVKQFLFHLEEQAITKGYVETALKRRASVDVNDNANLAQIKRFARNMPIQGTGADILKLAICRVHKAIHRKKLSANLINAVHDELVIECQEDHLDEVLLSIKEEMQRAFSAILPNVPSEITAEQRCLND